MTGRTYTRHWSTILKAFYGMDILLLGDEWYYTQYWSTILKSPWATAIKERFEARNMINNLKAADRITYKELPRLIEQEHMVTRADKEEDRLIKELNTAAAKGYSLAFNDATMDMAILKCINSLIDAWHHIDQAIKKSNSKAYEVRMQKLDEFFTALLYKAIEQAENEERGSMKDVMILVNQSEKSEHRQFMEIVRDKFKTLEKQSSLAKLAISMDIRREQRFFKAIKVVTYECKKVTKRMQREGLKPNSMDNYFRQFESFINQSANSIKQVFYYAHLIKKRDFLLMLQIIVNIDVLSQLNRKWASMHFMPEAFVQKKELSLKKIEESISKKFHTIAQALRISISGLEGVESSLKKVHV